MIWIRAKMEDKEKGEPGNVTKDIDLAAFRRAQARKRRSEAAKENVDLAIHEAEKAGAGKSAKLLKRAAKLLRSELRVAEPA